ncbi:aminoglycoside phosphotransferase family protein [Kribbella sp. NPDC023972]|uniref:phosphotransferase family protein n=1 Tax=Kribbella sp. NPDC023972 TaxID=3154795 RepID=UPI0033EB8D3D
MPTPLDDALAIACRHNNLDPVGARLIHHYSNAVYLLPAVPAIARIATGADPGRLRATQTVTSWLGQQGFGATTPLSGTELVEVDETTAATFWTYYPQPEPGTGKPLTSRDLGALIRALHDTGEPPADLVHWTPLESLERALNSAAADTALRPQDRDWLRHRVAEVRAELAELPWPLGHGLIHGDAWAGNLLWDTTGAQRPILCDWDSVGHGPREVDLIPTWHAAVRYGRDETWIEAFVTEYGYDLRDWAGFDVLLTMRDLAQLPGPLRRSTNPPHAAALRQRLGAIRAGDRTSTWVAL